MDSVLTIERPCVRRHALDVLASVTLGQMRSYDANRASAMTLNTCANYSTLRQPATQFSQSGSRSSFSQDSPTKIGSATIGSSMRAFLAMRKEIEDDIAQRGLAIDAEASDAQRPPALLQPAELETRKRARIHHQISLITRDKTSQNTSNESQKAGFTVNQDAVLNHLPEKRTTLSLDVAPSQPQKNSKNFDELSKEQDGAIFETFTIQELVLGTSIKNPAPLGANRSGVDLLNGATREERIDRQAALSNLRLQILRIMDSEEAEAREAKSLTPEKSLQLELDREAMREWFFLTQDTIWFPELASRIVAQQKRMEQQPNTTEKGDDSEQLKDARTLLYLNPELLKLGIQVPGSPVTPACKPITPNTSARATKPKYSSKSDEVRLAALVRQTKDLEMTLPKRIANLETIEKSWASELTKLCRPLEEHWSYLAVKESLLLSAKQNKARHLSELQEIMLRKESTWTDFAEPVEASVPKRQNTLKESVKDVEIATKTLVKHYEALESEKLRLQNELQIIRAKFDKETIKYETRYRKQELQVRETREKIEYNKNEIALLEVKVNRTESASGGQDAPIHESRLRTSVGTKLMPESQEPTCASAEKYPSIDVGEDSETISEPRVRKPSKRKAAAMAAEEQSTKPPPKKPFPIRFVVKGGLADMAQARCRTTLGLGRPSTSVQLS